MKIKLWFLLLLSTLTIFSCKKNSTDSTSATATSTWSFDGKTYSVTGALVNSSNVLIANDDPGIAGGGNYVKIIFGAATRPSVSSTLTVTGYIFGNPSNCFVQVGNIYDPVRTLGYISTGKAGDKVVVTVSSSGKLTATFTNITVSDNQTPSTIKTVSGTIVEQ